MADFQLREKEIFETLKKLIIAKMVIIAVLIVVVPEFKCSLEVIVHEPVDPFRDRGIVDAVVLRIVRLDIEDRRSVDRGRHHERSGLSDAVRGVSHRMGAAESDEFHRQRRVVDQRNNGEYGG